MSDRLIHQIYQTTRAMTKSINQLLEVYGLFSSEWTIINSIKQILIETLTLACASSNLASPAQPIILRLSRD